MKSNIVVYQPIFSTNALVEPGFTPLDLGNPRPEWRELQFMVELYRRGEHRKHSHLGLVSPKFRLKAGVAGADFISFVKKNEHVDVAFLNPFPQIAYWSYNVWHQADYAHPGIRAVADALLRATGSPLDIAAHFRNDLRTLAYCNFWVGNELFWDRYVGGVLEPIARLLESEPEHPAARAAMMDTVHTDRAPYLPFIIERLFSTFLAVDPAITFMGYRGDGEWVSDCCVNRFEQLLYQRLRNAVDAADQIGSFSTCLRDTMDLACCVWQQQFFDYFSVRAHPHTGRSVIPN